MTHMTIPPGFRRLAQGEIIRGEDIYERGGGLRDAFSRTWPEAAGGHAVGHNDGVLLYTHYGDTWQILRRIESSQWINKRERYPVETDLDRQGFLLAATPDGVKRMRPRGVDFASVTYWMAIPPLPTIIIEDGSGKNHAITFDSNGDVRIGCATITKATMSEIVARWKEVYAAQ